MNYRALEDLINILVKKTGYKLNDLKLEEDIDSLEERKKDLEEEKESLDKENTKDKYIIESIDREIEIIENSLNIKFNNPVILGNKLLDAYRNNDTFDSVSETFDTLVRKARSEYDKTHEEVKPTNIFELIDKYSTKKKNTLDKLDNTKYFSDENKESMVLRIGYHNSRIEELKRELEVIDRKKEEILSLQNYVEDVLKKVNKDIESKTNKLNSLIRKLYKENSISNDEKVYNTLINTIRYEISDLVYLKEQYELDIENYKEKLKDLDIKVNDVNERLNDEEKLLNITQDKIEQKENDLLDRLNDNIEGLNASNRVNNLTNEQQYLYVNVDVIRDEIINLWNRDNTSIDKKEEKEEELDRESIINSSMYDDSIEEGDKEHDEVKEKPIEDKQDEEPEPVEKQDEESDEGDEENTSEEYDEEIPDDNIEVIDYLD